MPNLVTVLITAGMSKAEVQASQAADVAGLIAKPFDALTLAREVRALAQSARPSRSGIAWLGRALH